ncbi:UPF0481 protein At3g47200-like [Macadamia integrifolia]|uniref:UPF0481 protein At3g47200-like n=1 Tax=Macadamia integrifolia TaxID=60698 RepID=UPI001C4F84F7|nr:UPF0481 protein At3g47200-like [Macadamia integrifolia]
MATGASSFSDSTMRNEGYDDRQLKNNDEIKKLVQSMEKKLEEVSYLQSNYDIYRVPTSFHKLNSKAYTPLSVSIGPLHYKDEHLQKMKTHKLRYLNRFLNQPNGKSLEIFVKVVSDLEEEARKCYSEIVDLRKEDFVEMKVMDGCFILQLLKTMAFGEKDHFVSHLSWYFEILADLIKLENQIPFFVLEQLYGLIFDRNKLSFNHFIYAQVLANFAVGLHGPIHGSFEQLKSLPMPKGRVKHFLDLLRYVLVPSSPRESGESFLPLTCCASELKSAGVKFEKKESSGSTKTYLFDIDFNKDKGVLRIPTIVIDNVTELVLRNLIAFEQGQDCTAYFTSYACFMEYLINTPTDAELLIRKGIIRNYFGNPEDVVNLFSNLGKYTVLGNDYFFDVTKDLEEYHKRAWNKSKASLVQTYFNTPWASISCGAAALLLFLAIIQTICSILQVIP